MNYTVTEESFDSLDSLRNDPGRSLNWNHVFSLPVWMRVWWRVFGEGAELRLNAVRDGEKVIGVSPLAVRDGTAHFVGSADVCDYLDFVVSPGRETDFFNTMLDYLKEQGINSLELESLRPDSAALTGLADIAINRSCKTTIRRDDVSLDLALPATFEEYLEMLNSKQRHEVRRKLRRLAEAGEINYRLVSDGKGVSGAMDTFLQMFTESREDKADFLTGRMEMFFRLLTEKLAEAGLLRLGILELDSVPTAMVICFDYNNGIYLYNSGYDPRYVSLSAGLMSKVLCIKESIEEKRRVFDFLKGEEIYKYRLGGKEIPLYRCRIDIG
jgi:CelD/BcsL family acetyltransferase involved in cellulose biosynthesis